MWERWLRVIPLFDMIVEPHTVCSTNRVDDIFQGELKCRPIRDGDRKRVRILQSFIKPRMSKVDDIDTVYVFSSIITTSSVMLIGVDDKSRVVRPKIPDKIIVIKNNVSYIFRPMYETRQQLWISLLKKLKFIVLYNENGRRWVLR